MDKNVQNNCIVLTGTIPQYYSPRHTLRTSVAASQQLLQAPRSPDPPAKALLANTHTMSLGRRKQHQHDARHSMRLCENSMQASWKCHSGG